MKIRIRADSVEIEGYVNAVGRDSRKLIDDYGYPYVEQIQPGAFAKALAEHVKNETPIKILLNHKEERELGDTATNLTLEEDTIGLHAVAVITDPEVMEKARSREIVGWSFGFRILDSTEEYSQKGRRQIVTELDLIEVSLIDGEMTPCYAGTSVHARADGEVEKILTRASDNEAVYHIREQVEKEEVAPVQQKTAEEKRGQQSGDEPEKETTQKIDYKIYEDTIKQLRAKGGSEDD